MGHAVSAAFGLADVVCGLRLMEGKSMVDVFNGAAFAGRAFGYSIIGSQSISWASAAVYPGALWEYHFTDFKTKGHNGPWWRREIMGLYCPTVSLNNLSYLW